MPVWALLALTAALTQAVQFAAVKRRAAHVPPFVLAFWIQGVGAAGWAIWLAATGAPLALPRAAWPWVGFAVALASVMIVFLIRATARGDISLVGPLLALAPGFTIVPDWLLSGALPRGWGWLGLGLMLAGTASLGLLGTPGGLRALARRRDALAALTAALLLGLLTAVDRKNALALGVPLYVMANHAGVALVMGTLALWRDRGAFRRSCSLGEAPAMLAIAAVTATGTTLLITASTLAPAAYASALRRSSAVFAVLLGRFLFGEPGFAGRLLGALLTCAGIAVLVLAG